MFFKIVAEDFKIVENTCVGVFFNKAAGVKAFNLAKKRLQHKCFSVKVAKFLRTAFL